MSGDAERDGVTFTHLDQPLFDDAAATKRDLADYLDAVGGRIVPVLAGRPLSVIRVRPGQAPFMQKNVPGYAPPWVQTVPVWADASRRTVSYVLCNDRRTLLWLANQRAAAYTPRIRAGVTVSFPVPWDELDRVHPADFTVRTVPGLLGDGDPWAALMPPPQRLSPDLIAEGHAIPVARVQAMHEGKRRARARRG